MCNMFEQVARHNKTTKLITNYDKFMIIVNVVNYQYPTMSKFMIIVNVVNYE